MKPHLFEDDIIIVKQQPDVESGEFAVVLVNGDEATIKQIKKADNGLTLIGYNVAVYPPTFTVTKILLIYLLLLLVKL